MNKQAVLLAMMFVGLSTAAVASDVYVAPGGNDQSAGARLTRPVATLARAQELARELRKAHPDQPVTVHVQGGAYALTQPWTFGPEDSGASNAPVTYVGEGRNPAVLDGGRRITGWKQHDARLWSVDLPEVKAGAWNFRELFVNGERRSRARIPRDGFLHVTGFPDAGRENYHKPSQHFQFKAGDLNPQWTNLQDVEVIVYHFWTDSHLVIQSINTASNLVTFQYPADKAFIDDFTTNGARYVVENVFEGLDQPGEWYLNRRTGTLFYYPKPGEDVTRAVVVAPVAPALLQLSGDAVRQKFVEHITFSNLVFRFARFELPPGDSNGKQGAASVAAAVTLVGVQHCRFTGCEFCDLGTFAVDLKQGCRGNEFVGNTLHHLAAGGFRLNGGTEKDHPLLRTGSNLITDNHLHHYGELYPSAVGILLMNTAGNSVAHNHIHHGWYTGISIGWTWGYGRSVSRDNRIEFNHIHHIGQGLLSDMGAIYTLGISPGTVIRNNLIHDVDSNNYGGWGIYNDEGSSHILIENNVVYHTKFAGYNIHYGRELVVRNNIFALGRKDQVNRTRAEAHRSVFFENNIVYWLEGDLLQGNWKDKSYTQQNNPNHPATEQHSTFDMDWNLYFNPTQKVEQVKWGDDTWAQWRKRGKDVHSVYADPKFVDPEHGDFRLAPDSPAWALGFQPIDLSTVGPRPPWLQGGR